MSAVSVAGPCIQRIHRDAGLLFSQASLDALHGRGIPAPKVTLDLPRDEPEGLHVFTWGTAREFGIAGALTNYVITVTFHVWMTVLAAAGTAERAAEIAAAYQATALQIPLADITLGGEAVEVGAPAIRQAEAWGDGNGRRHAGYLLDFEVAKQVERSSIAAGIIETA